MVYGFRSADPVFEANMRIPLELVGFLPDLLDTHGPVAKVVQRVLVRTHLVECSTPIMRCPSAERQCRVRRIEIGRHPGGGDREDDSERSDAR